MLVWLPGTALVTTALCWLPGRCWSYSQYTLEICCATEYLWYWSGTLILGDYGIRYLVSEFGLRFGIVCWNPEFGLSFWEVSGVIMALQYYGQYYLSPVHCARRILISQGGYWYRREDTDSAGRILIDYLFGWRVWYRAVSSTEQGGCRLCFCKIGRRWQFQIIREFQW